MNATPDPEIIRFADDENRIVISKDSDFLDNYILDRSPKKTTKCFKWQHQ